MGYWDDVNPRTVSEAAGYSEFAVGDNEAFIDKVEETTSKNSGKEMLVVTFAKKDGATIRWYIVNDEYKLGKLKQLYVAFSIPMGETDTGKWLGRTGIVVCKQGEPYGESGKVYNKVSYLKSIPRPASAGGAQQQSAHGGYPAITEDNHPEPEFADDIPF